MPAVEPRYHTLPSTASSQSATALSSVFGGGKCRTHPRGYSRRRIPFCSLWVGSHVERKEKPLLLEAKIPPVKSEK
jgi:hypothetical protein